MRKIITILCIFALTLSLFGCSKPRYAENYSVGQYQDGWSVLYTDEDGVEEIVALGKERQPLAIEKGRIYFAGEGKLISVDMEGRDRQETEIAGMDKAAVLTFADEQYFYCLADRSGRTCWRISKTDPADQAEVDIPHAFRPTDYAALLEQIRTAVAATDNIIHLRSGKATLDSNGSVLALDLELLYYMRYEGYGMKTWKTCRVTADVSLSGVKLTHYNENLNLSVSDKTIGKMLSLEEYLTALEAVDKAQIAAARAQGAAEEFRVMYQVSEYEACVAGNKGSLAYVDVSGAAVDANEKARHLVLAQVGGCDTMLTDSQGTACGNLTVVQVG